MLLQSKYYPDIKTIDLTTYIQKFSIKYIQTEFKNTLKIILHDTKSSSTQRCRGD